MKKEIIITTGIIIFALVFAMVFIIFKAPTTNINYDAETQYLKEIEKAFVVSNYTCDDNYCFVNDDKVYLNCTASSFNPECTISTKNFTGNADMVFLFDTTEVKPISLEYNPQTQTIEESFTCEDNYIVDTVNKHLFCYSTTTDDVSTYNSTIFNGSYDRGNLQTKTVYWDKEVTTWTKYNRGYEMERINFKNMTRKYTLSDIPFTANQERKFRLNLIPITTAQKHKYWIGIKPSALTWNEAIEQNKYMVLDPWTPDLNTNIIAYWSFNQTGAGDNAIDSVLSLNNHEGTSSGTSTIAGKISSAFDYSPTDYVEITNSTNLNFTLTTDSFSWAGWFYQDNVDTSKQHILGTGTATAPDAWVRSMSDNRLQWLVRDKDYDSASIQSASAVSSATWYHLTVTFDAIQHNASLWLDGSLLGSTVSANIDGYILADNWFFGSGENTILLNGRTDEFGVWGEVLSKTKIEGLYNSGTGITYQQSIIPSINILFPINSTVYTTPVDYLNYTVDASGESCWYSADQGASNSSFVTAGNNFSISTVPAWNNFTLYCNSSSGDVGLNTTDFYINKSVGTVLILPITTTLTTNTSILFEYNNTVLNTNLTNATFYLWWDNGTVINQDTYTLSGNETVNNRTIKTIGEGEYIWNVQTCGNDVSCNFGVTNFSFDIDIDGPIPLLTYPTGVLGAVVDGTTLNLNWTISETGENMTEHLQNCSYTYNGSTTYMVKATCLANYTTFGYSAGKDNITFTAWDIFNLSNEATTSWIVSLSEINQTYNAFTTEGAEEDFLIYVTVNPVYSITASQLIYNGTTYTGTTTDLGGNVFRALRTITIPSVTATGNVTFYWRFAFNDTSIVNSLSKNQSIANVLIDNCSTYTYKLLELEAIDEEEQTHINETTLNTSIEVDINVYSNDLSVSLVNYSNIFNRTNPVSICTNSNMSNALKYDAIIKYSAENYSSEYYNVQRGTLQYGLIPYNISLFDLLTEDATDFQITFKDSSFLVIEDALINIARQYVGEGTFKTVEIPKTDSNGQTVAHLVTNDIIYNMVVTKNGEVIGVFNNLIAFCEDKVTGSCFINLNAIGNNTALYDYSSSTGIDYSLDYNKTSRLLTFAFVTTDGNIKTINLTAVKMDQLGNTSACDEVLISSSGIITCNVASSIGNETLFINIYADNQLVANDYVKAGDKFNLGDTGYLFLIFMLLSFPLMFSSSKTGVIIGVLLGFISASLLSIIQGGVIGLGASLLWLIISGLILIYIINTKRET